MPTTSYTNAQKSLFGYTESPYMVLPTPACAWACPPPPIFWFPTNIFAPPNCEKCRIFRHFFSLFATFSQNFHKLLPSHNTDPQPPTRATPYKRDPPLFPRSVFSLAFFIADTRYCSLTVEIPIKDYLAVYRMNEVCDYRWRKIV